MRIIHREQKPVYCLNVTYLKISHYYQLSDKKFKSIAGLFPNIVYLNLYNSAGFGDKTLNRIAKSYPNLKYLNLQKSRYISRNGGIVTDKGLCAIAQSCHKLEYLNISCRKEFSEIAIWNVIHSCPMIQQLDISNCNIACATIKEIELYIKIRYLNPGIATRYLEKIGRIRICQFEIYQHIGYNKKNLLRMYIVHIALPVD